MADNLYQYYLTDDPQGTKESSTSLGSQTTSDIKPLVQPGEQPPEKQSVTEQQVRTIVTDMLSNLSKSGTFAGTNQTIPGYQLVSNNYMTAGERLEQGNAVCIINDFKQVNNDQDSVFGDASARTRYGLKFTSTTNATAAVVKIIIKKIAAPVDDVTIEIQGDSGGSPDGTAITNGTSGTVNGAALTTEYAVTTFTFASAFTLARNTPYWIVVKRSGAVDAVNHYSLRTYSTNYATFSAKTYDGAAWNTASALIYADIVTTTGDQSINLWKTDADVQALAALAGFSAGTYYPAMTARITTSGIDGHQSGLVKGLTYYLSGTAGAISTTPGTFGSKVGFAISATDIQIFGGAVMTAANGGFQKGLAGTTIDQTIITGFKPKTIQINAGSSTIGCGISWGFILSENSYNCLYSIVGTGVSNNVTNATSSYAAYITDAALAVVVSAVPVALLDNGFILRWTVGASGAGAFIVYNWIANG